MIFKSTALSTLSQLGLIMGIMSISFLEFIDPSIHVRLYYLYVLV